MFKRNWEPDPITDEDVQEDFVLARNASGEMVMMDELPEEMDDDAKDA